MADEHPRIAFKQPFFQDEIIASSVEKMRRSITSATTLEAAYRIAGPEARSRGISASREHAEEALALYNKAIQDGRFIKRITTDPAYVAEQLGVQLSPEAASLMQQTGTLSVLQAEQSNGVPVASDVELVAVAIIVIMLVSAPDVDVVIDESGQVKL